MSDTCYINKLIRNSCTRLPLLLLLSLPLPSFLLSFFFYSVLFPYQPQLPSKAHQGSLEICPERYFAFSPKQNRGCAGGQPGICHWPEWGPTRDENSESGSLLTLHRALFTSLTAPVLYSATTRVWTWPVVNCDPKLWRKQCISQPELHCLPRASQSRPLYQKYSTDLTKPLCLKNIFWPLSPDQRCLRSKHDS